MIGKSGLKIVRARGRNALGVRSVTTQRCGRCGHGFDRNASSVSARFGSIISESSSRQPLIPLRQFTSSSASRSSSSSSSSSSPQIESELWNNETDSDFKSKSNIDEFVVDDEAERDDSLFRELDQIEQTKIEADQREYERRIQEERVQEEQAEKELQEKQGNDNNSRSDGFWDSLSTSSNTSRIDKYNITVVSSKHRYRNVILPAPSCDIQPPPLDVMNLADHTFLSSPCEMQYTIGPEDEFPPGSQNPEIAFAGRSNVGKSSLINALLGRKKVAKTSNTPGFTKRINFFSLDSDITPMYLVDMPGYGHAEASQEQIKGWHDLIYKFISGRRSLKKVLLLIDARHGIKDSDKEFLEFVQHFGIPSQIALTKCDKLTDAELVDIMHRTYADISAFVGCFPYILPTSSTTLDGMRELRSVLLQHSGLIEIKRNRQMRAQLKKEAQEGKSPTDQSEIPPEIPLSPDFPYARDPSQLLVDRRRKNSPGKRANNKQQQQHEHERGGRRGESARKEERPAGQKENNNKQKGSSEQNEPTKPPHKPVVLGL